MKTEEKVTECICPEAEENSEGEGPVGVEQRGKRNNECTNPSLCLLTLKC